MKEWMKDEGSEDDEWGGRRDERVVGVRGRMERRKEVGVMGGDELEVRGR